MSVTSMDKDLEGLTLTVIADFQAPIGPVWQLWADPRQLERWWGPPTHPATVEQHDLNPGGEVTYHMTAPDGQQFRGWWKVTTVTPPRSLEFSDGFADDTGAPNPQLPVTTVRMQLTEHDGGTRMHLLSVYNSRQEMEQILDMGAAEGLQQALGQMDALLAA
jgi:uncharacterized protein YndB with AHSA1/START domain